MSRLRRLVKTALGLRRTARALGETTLGRRAVEQVRATRDAYHEGRHGTPPPPRPPEERPQDPQVAEWYANLEVPYGSDLDTVTRAWKRLMARYHPDRHAKDAELDARATELTQALNRAYEGLKDRLE